MLSFRQYSSTEAFQNWMQPSLDQTTSIRLKLHILALLNLHTQQYKSKWPAFVYRFSSP